MICQDTPTLLGSAHSYAETTCATSLSRIANWLDLVVRGHVGPPAEGLVGSVKQGEFKMKKWMILAGLSLFLFGCSDDEEGGCNSDADCETGEVCQIAETTEEEGSATGEALEGEAAEQAANAGGDIAAGAASDALGALGGGDAAAGTCVTAELSEEEGGEPEEIVVDQLGPGENILSVDGAEYDHVEKGCDTFDNANADGAPGIGFCYDTDANAGFCEGIGGTEDSGKCDGGATKCCTLVACDANNSKNESAEGVCMGQVAPSQGGDPAPAFQNARVHLEQQQCPASST